MKKKYSIFFLALLLIIQLYVYRNQFIEQTKEVKNPTSPTVEAVVETTEDEELEELEEKETIRKTTMEELSFEKNPTEEYYQLNSDYVGWLTINDTAIDYPVVRGKDNDFYLNHNFYKEEDIFGAIFMDARNAGMGLDKHTVIYGHYTKYGQMFKDLERYLSEEFLTEHSEFVFSDAFTTRRYKIFSVHYSYADPTLIDVSFESDEFEAFVNILEEKSLFSTETNVSAEDQILTLITCNYTIENGRLFIHAVEINE